MNRTISLFFAVAIAGCSGGSPDSMTMAPDMTPPNNWSYGTGGQIGEYEDYMMSGDTSHRFALHTPPGYDPAKGLPLVIHFHGLAQTLPFDITGKLDKIWVPTADAQNFIAAAPEAPPCPQMPNDPNPVGCWSPQRDSAFVKDFIKYLAGLYNIDLDRVYMSGHSNGAFFVDANGLIDSTDFAAAVSFDGGCSPDTGYETSCPTLDAESKAATRKMPYFTIHFPDDQVVPSSWTDSLIEILNADGHITKQLDNYDNYDAGGHGHTPDPKYVPTIWAWLSTFTKNSPQ